MADNNNDNRHDENKEALLEIKGPVIDVNELKRADGLINNRGGQHTGVLVRAMVAHPPEEFLQEVKVANFSTPDEADECVSAYYECIVLGMDPAPIHAQMVARSAGVHQNLLMRIFETITHTSVTTNFQKDKNAGIKASNNSPFS